MAPAPVLNSLDSLPARLHRVEKAFSDLDSQRSLLANCTTGWKELEEYFSELHTTIQSKFLELGQKEKEFAAKIEQDKVDLGKREEAIAAREKASLARVQEQKDAAIAALLEEKRKWVEGHKGRGSTEGHKGKGSIEGHKGKGSVEGHKGKGSSAVAAPSPKPRVVDALPLKSDSAVDTKRTAADGQAKSLIPEVDVRPQLKSYCDNMDGEGLRKYLVARQKENAVLRNELPCALQKAPDPVRLVFKALEGYHAYKLDRNPARNAAWASRRACISLLESLSLVLADPVLGVDHPVVSSNVKDLAKAVARSWRSKLDVNEDGAIVSALDVQAFLQLLATFGIASEYKDDELLKLVTEIARRWQTPALCRTLGLTAKIPDLVDKLVKEGKQIEALSFANAFDIMDRIQPVSLLKDYLKEVKVATQLAVKNAPDVATGQNEAISKELSALKAVLKAVEQYKLESQYPTDSLQKRVDELEKVKAERKRPAAAAVQMLEKKPRPSDTATAGFKSSTGTAPTSAAAGVAATRDNSLYRPSERGQYGGAFPSYGLSTASSLQPQAGFASAYGTGTRSSAPLSSSYLYPSDGIGSAYGSSAPYSTLSGSYGGYQYTSALAAPSSYQSVAPSAYQSAAPQTYKSFAR